MPGKKAAEDERRSQIIRAAYRVAARERLDGLTIRGVAAEAGVSPGLVFFHYKNKEALLLSLLEWLLQTTIIADVGPDILAFEHPTERLHALLRQELQRIGVNRTRLELFFDYWVLGSHNPAIRQLIRAAFDRYQATFRVMPAAIIAQQPHRFVGMTAEGLAMIIVSMIQGYVIQAVKAPEDIDMTPMLASLDAIMELVYGLGEKHETSRV